MNRISTPSFDVLLTRLNREVETLSESQHRLARKKAVLQEQITRLRLGASPTEVRLVLKAAAVPREGRRRWPADWLAMPTRDPGTDRRGRR
jgi:hypothetical protein